MSLEISVQAMASTIIPSLKVGLIAIFMIIICAAAFYYFFIVARRKKWVCRVYEMKADGKLHLIGEDILIRKLLEFGKKAIYQFKKTKYYCSNPPDNDCVQRVGGKEFVDYLRVGIAYYPLKRDNVELLKQVNEIKPKYLELLKKITSFITFKQIKETKTERVYAPMFVPMHDVLCVENKFKAMSYDLDMMRMASVDTREQMYQKQKSFWEQYKEPIVWALLIMSVIIVGYLSFEYMKSVMSQNINLCQSAIEKCSSSIPTVTPPLT